MSTLAVNKKANFDYSITDKYEAGLVLLGHETRSVKLGHISLKESFVTVHSGELYLTNAHISPYKYAGKLTGYNPTRPRKILLRKREISHLIGKIKEKGLTLVPIRMYTKGRLVKLEFGVGKGKKQFDKRHDIKKREDTRQINRTLKSHNM